MAGSYEYGIMFFVSVIVVLALIYIFIHMDNFLYFLKLKKSRTVDDETLDLLFSALKGLWTALSVMFLVGLALVLDLGYARDAWSLIQHYIFAVFVFFLIMVVVWFVAKVLSHRIESSKQRAMADPDAYVRAGVLDFYELFVKYFIYGIGFVVALFSALQVIPDEEQRQRIFDWLGVTSIDVDAVAASMTAYLVLIVVIYLVWKLVSLMLDDFKKKSRKFPPRVIDLIKAFVKYGLTWLGLVVTLTIVLDIFAFQYVELVVYLLVAATFVLIFIVALSPTTREAFNGVALLLTDSVNKGDWIEADGLVEGRVISQNLLTTRMATTAGDIVDVPNHRLAATVVRNLTRAGRREMTIDLPPGVTNEVALAIASSVEGVLQEPRPEVYHDIGDKGIATRRMRFHVSDFAKARATRESLASALVQGRPPAAGPFGR
jgi:small-conductance mechanosensitive channel